MGERSAEQRAIDEAEWANPANWGGVRWAGLYFSKRDSRVLVPKRLRFAGWTFNLAHGAGVFWFCSLVALGVLAPVIVVFAMLNTQHM